MEMAGNHHKGISAGSSNVITYPRRARWLQDDTQESRDSDIETAMQKTIHLQVTAHCL
jgi:hypothetical protein